MKNFVSVGDSLTVTAPAALASGDGVLFGVAANDIANGAEGVINLTGVYDLPKAPSQTWTVGAKVYWDDANDRCTATAGSLSLIGVVVAAVGAGAGETVGRVRLNGVSA